MADVTGWQMLGNALGGESETSYQKGLAMGANTQNALAQARARVDENRAKGALADVIGKIPGVSPEMAAAASTTLRAGGNLGDAFEAALKNQTFGFNQRIADPNVPLDEAQRLVLTKSTNPVEPLYKIGGGYANKFDSGAGITPLGDALGSDGGGKSAALQLVDRIEADERRVRNDPNFHLSPAQVIGIARETQRITDAGGVPNMVDLRTALGLSGGPTAPSAPLPPQAAPSAPVAAPSAPSAAPATPMTPLTTPEQIGANVAQIERDKAVGRERGQAYASLPQSQALLRNQTQNIDSVIGQIDKALGITDWSSAGPMGAIFQNLAFTDAGSLKRIVDSVKANTGFQQLQQMRAENATGAGLGQIAVQELMYLQAALGNMDTAQTPGDLATALTEVRRRYGLFRQAMEQDFQNKLSFATGGAPIPGVGPQGAAPGTPGAMAPMSLDDYLKTKGF